MCEGRMDVTEGYKDHINEPSHEFSSYFEIIKRFFEGHLGSRRVQLKLEEAATFKRTESSEEAFQYEKLTETILRSKERVVAILGSAGAGKTMLSKRIIRDLRKSKGTQQLVLFKYFRDFSDEKEITLSHLLFGGLFEDDSMETKGYKWLLKNQDKAILILDGLDQSSSLINSKAKRINQHGKGKTSEIISNIFRGDLLPKVKIVYTSREHAVASLEGKCRPGMVIMMTGLSQIDVESLFISLVGDKGKDLWHKLVSQSHSLVPLLSTPVFVIFAAIVYKTSTGEPPQFVTGLMLEILELFKGSDHILDRNIAKIMSGLEKMSFDGLQQNMVLFMVKHVEAAGLKLEEIIDWMIKVPGRNKLNQYLLEGTEVLFYSHQSIQEILGGCHVSKLPLPEFTTVVHEYLSNDYWSLTLRFVSGILFNKETEEYRANIGDVQEKQKVLKEMLASKYKNANDNTEKLSVLAAISESNDKEFIQSVIDSIEIYTYPISAAGMHVIGSILRHCQLLENLVLWECSLDDTTANILWQCVSDKDCNVQVKKLNLGGNELSDVALSSAGHIIQNDGELELHNCSLTSSGLEHLQTALGGKKVKKLNLSENELSDVALSSAGHFIQNDGELELQECSLTSSGLEQLKKALGDKKVKKLILKYNNLSDVALSCAGHIIQNDGELDLFQCSLTSSGLEHLKTALGKKKVKILNLRGNELSDVALSSAGHIIQNDGELNLYDCSLTSGGLEHLKRALGDKKVKKLDLEANALSDVALSSAGHIIQNDGKLKLYNCSLTSSGLKHLETALGDKKVKKLDLSVNELSDVALSSAGHFIQNDGELELYGCSLTSSGLEQLKKALGDKKISTLNIAQNTIDLEMASTVGKITKQSSIDKLHMYICSLTDEGLNNFLAEAKGSKLSILDVRENLLSKAAIDLIRQSISVEKIDDAHQMI